MKVTFVGTGTMGCTTRCNTSVLVDDILFDMDGTLIDSISNGKYKKWRWY